MPATAAPAQRTGSLRQNRMGLGVKGGGHSFAMPDSSSARDFHSALQGLISYLLVLGAVSLDSFGICLIFQASRQSDLILRTTQAAVAMHHFLLKRVFGTMLITPASLSCAEFAALRKNYSLLTADIGRRPNLHP